MSKRRRLPSADHLRRISDVKKFPRVCVEWIDASSTHGWFSPEEIRKEGRLTIRSRTVGHLMRRDKVEIQLAQTVSSHGKVSEVWSIPTPWIVRIIRL